MSVKRVSTPAQFSQELLPQGITLVDFDAPWCPPCKVLGPLLDQLHEDYKGALNLVKVNCDESPELASTYGIMSLPTVIMFHNGEPVEKLVGLRPREAYDRMIEKYHINA
ncbi:thioredoxin domain-containing protein [Paenibacillus vini]|uniref:thioredoxin family protein n=1 Tax=Paenibacillus vini TaxID=1476024 RepID=UPI0025B686EC|nr:thioredoxin domain-containing protein [Paenibacillus vini]MDN4071018.1 thioredoxin domain-containing protein [Paenibacillus vini]